MIGKNIQEKRKALGLTQAQVAELLGVTPPAVNRWEKDLCYPDAAIPEMERCILQKAVDLCFSLYLMRDTYLLNGNPEKSALAEQKADQVQSVFALWNGLQGFSKISKAVAQSNIDDEKESLSFLMNELKSDDQRISTCSLFSGIKQTQSEEESVPSTILLDDILHLLHPSDR